MVRGCSVLTGVVLLCVVMVLVISGQVDARRRGRHKNACLQPKKIGPCKAAMIRFYYDQDNKKCTRFFFGGCRANRNNFRSEEYCQKRCIPSTVDNNNNSNLNKDNGNNDQSNLHNNNRPNKPNGPNSHRPNNPNGSNSHRPNNPNGSNKPNGSNSHRPNNPNGPNSHRPNNHRPNNHRPNNPNGPNSNRPNKPERPDSNHTNMSNSNSSNSNQHPNRGQRGEDVCQLPSKTGPCRARFRMYYYDTVSGQCQRFIYGGCRGNGNRFRNEASCMARCGGGGDGTSDLSSSTTL